MLQINNIIVGDKNKVSRTFEVLGHCFLLITISMDLEASYDLLHWRLFHDGNPPLDIVISGRTGRFKELTCFIGDKRITELKNANQVGVTIIGNPVFSTEVWDNKTYVDFPGELNFSFAGRCLILNLANEEITKSLILSENLTFLFSEGDLLAGIVLEDLNLEEIETLKSSDLL